MHYLAIAAGIAAGTLIMSTWTWFFIHATARGLSIVGL